MTGNTNWDFTTPLLPFVKNVEAHTLGASSWKSEKQIKKELRINKLRKLEGKKPNVVLPDDVQGLQSVTPLSAPPSAKLFYYDYVYEPTQNKYISKPLKKRGKKK